MRQYQTFIFDSYTFDPKAGKIELRYSLDDELRFTETLLLPQSLQLTAYSLQLDAALSALHLIAGISYYKTCCPKVIEIRSGSLTQKQADFWNTVYTKGLGEFCYRNKIDFHDLIHFPVTQQSTINNQQSTPNPSPSPKLLVPIGGGKDSTVTAELLKRAGFDVMLLRIGSHPLIEEMARVAGLPLLVVERKLAPELFDLNAQGALNGHIPITAYLSILAVTVAELYGFDAVVMSNERSANEGNVEYLGETINHQWSKSLEFERMLRDYLRGIGSPVEYFSLLRPLSELAITKIFASMPQYFASTTSCNANWKLTARPVPGTGTLSSDHINKQHTSPSPSGEGLGVRGNPPGRGARGEGQTRWCRRCPKCAFAFALFAAFLPKDQLLSIFGGNLFEAKTLLGTYRQILGIEGFKPFECVGTPEETKAAFFLAEKRGEFNDSKAMQLFLKEVKPTIKDDNRLIDDALTPSADHCIPKQFSKLIAQSS